jgi:hypothetical protein
MLLRKNARIIDALNIGGVRPECQRVEAVWITAGHAYHDGAAPIFQRGDAARQVAGGNAVDDEIHALATGLGLDRLDEVLLDVVDRHICAEIRFQARKLCVIRCGREHSRTCPLRELQGRKTKRTGTGMNEDGLAFPQMAELE